MPFPLVVSCVDLICERVQGAQIARIDGEDSLDRLEMLELAIQKWHCRFMYLQVN